VSGRSIVAVANDTVAILAVCREIGMSVPGDVPHGRSVKVYCPFGPVYHVDHGVETAFRVYPHSNSAFCFAGCGYFSPVRLFADARDLNRQEAARQLLDLAGYKPVDLAAAWEHVQSPERYVDQSSLAEALKVGASSVRPARRRRADEVPGAAAPGEVGGGREPVARSREDGHEANT
jgi:hypothetical protein